MQTKSNCESFDFEYWSALAKNNPEAFESMRQKCLDELIAQAPVRARRRMEGLQWQIDLVRERSASPMAACLRISQMMWDSVTGENGLLEALESPEKLLRPKTTPDQNIIPLNGDKDS